MGQVKFVEDSLSQFFNSLVFYYSAQTQNYAAQTMKFSIKNFFSKRDQILSFLPIWSHLLKKSLSEILIFYAVSDSKDCHCFLNLHCMSILSSHSCKCYFSVQFKNQVATVTIYNFFLQVNARQPRLPLLIAQFFRAQSMEIAVVGAVIKVLFLSKYYLFLSNNGF